MKKIIPILIAFFCFGIVYPAFAGDGITVNEPGDPQILPGITFSLGWQIGG